MKRLFRNKSSKTKMAEQGITNGNRGEPVLGVPNMNTIDMAQMQQGNPAAPPPQQSQEPMMKPVSNPPVADAYISQSHFPAEDLNAVTRELVKKFVADIWNRGDVDMIPEVCHKSLRFNGSVGMDRVGHDGFARMVQTIRDALADYHCEVHSMVVEGNKAFARMRFTGRHTGPLLGFEPTGKNVAWVGASEFTIKDSKILKVWELGDVKSLEGQLSSIS